MKNVIRSLHQIRPSPIEEGDQIDDHYTSVLSLGLWLPFDSYRHRDRRCQKPFCFLMHRQPEHVMTFLQAEMGTSVSLDGQQRLVVNGRFTPKTFEGILRRYVMVTF
ncbi:uncharacterized protein LOC130750211 [Actinidia eriantha]|uniref:uncharacterized protein LOC130750211 n=1 Tax=Actinidia eriantha TaxID=165200 RepID=UPI0025825840|nr:uncharacterized protein LOC130750211 [Actinidia eriantha]XP_057459660.1 uncharacterized protein LOC130750211 [Actinidia eriantha]